MRRTAQSPMSSWRVSLLPRFFNSPLLAPFALSLRWRNGETRSFTHHLSLQSFRSCSATTAASSPHLRFAAFLPPLTRFSASRPRLALWVTSAPMGSWLENCWQLCCRGKRFVFLVSVSLSSTLLKTRLPLIVIHSLFTCACFSFSQSSGFFRVLFMYSYIFLFFLNKRRAWDGEEHVSPMWKRVEQKQMCWINGWHFEKSLCFYWKIIT